MNTINTAKLIASLPQLKEAPREKHHARRRERSRSLQQLALPADLDVPSEEGSRNSHVAKCAGHLFAAGADLEETIEIMIAWNINNPAPLDEAEIIRTCESIANTHERNHGVAAPDSSAELFDLRAASAGTLLSSEPPPRRWLIRDCLALGKVGLVVAPGGSSKSQLMLQLGVSVATGLPLADTLEMGETGSAVLLFAEEDTEDIQRRLHTICRQLAMTNKTEALNHLKSKLYVPSMVGKNNLMTYTRENGEVEPTDYVDRLLQTIRELEDLRLIVLDPASRFRGGEENSNEDATRFVEALEDLAQTTGATVLVCHHTNKGSFSSDEQQQTASRGASALTDGVRWQANLRTVTTSDAKKLSISEDFRRNHLLFDVTKNNYAAPIPPVLIRRGDGGFLTAVTPESAAADDELRKIKSILKAVDSCSVPLTQRQFEERIGGSNRDLGISLHLCRALLKECILRGYLSGGNRQKMRLTEEGKGLIQ
jgi:AAA domain/Primase C terminal 1 (PriCT-1)